MPANMLCGHDGAVIVKGFVASLVYCWFASESQRVAARFLGAGFQNVESEE